MNKLLQIFINIFNAITRLLGLSVIVLIILIIAAVTAAQNATPVIVNSKLISQCQPDKDRLAVVKLSGEISADEQTGFAVSSVGINPSRTGEIFNALESDAAVKVVLIEINSPGGAVVASDQIYRQLSKLRSKKPVIVQMGDVAASGGYYIAAAADKILANPATITGSIGVIMETPKYSALLDKVGVEMRTFKSGEFKDIGSPTREMTKEEKEIIQNVISDSYEQFVDVVASGRKMSVDKVKKLADGRIYSGKQAAENGLVDQLGNFEESFKLAKELSNSSCLSVYEYGSPDFLDSLLGAKSILSPLKTQLNIRQSGLYYLLAL